MSQITKQNIPIISNNKKERLSSISPEDFEKAVTTITDIIVRKSENQPTQLNEKKETEYDNR